MKREHIKTKSYFLLGYQCYGADSIWDYLITMDREPWGVYYRELRMPAGMPDVNDETYLPWRKVDIDVQKLEQYFKSKAMPENWKEADEEVDKSIEPMLAMDGPWLHAKWMKGKKKILDMGFDMVAYPEKVYPSFQKAMRLKRYLEKEGKVEKGYDRFIL